MTLDSLHVVWCREVGFVESWWLDAGEGEGSQKSNRSIRRHPLRRLKHGSDLSSFVDSQAGRGLDRSRSNAVALSCGCSFSLIVGNRSELSSGVVIWRSRSRGISGAVYTSSAECHFFLAQSSAECHIAAAGRETLHAKRKERVRVVTRNFETGSGSERLS
jgi:hypothetical protein